MRDVEKTVMEMLRHCRKLAPYMSAVFTWLLIRAIRKRRRITDVTERRVFITGCDTGFGRSLALRLDSQGVWVYAGCLHQKSVEELTVSCSKRLKAFLVDVRSTESIRVAADLVKKDLGGQALWAVVNNAGVLGSRIPFEWTTREHLRTILEVNLLGTYDVTLAFLPLLKTAGQGRIVIMSSANGRFNLNAHGYPISKFAVEGFSDGLSHDVKPYNLTVHVIEPGLFRTPMLNMEAEREMTKNEFFSLTAEKRKNYGEKYLEKYLEYAATMYHKRASPHTHHVIDAYEHAILSKYPRNRYLVGRDAKYVDGLLSYMPVYIQMLAFGFIERMIGARLPLPISRLER